MKETHCIDMMVFCLDAANHQKRVLCQWASDNIDMLFAVSEAAASVAGQVDFLRLAVKAGQRLWVKGRPAGFWQNGRCSVNSVKLYLYQNIFRRPPL